MLLASKSEQYIAERKAHEETRAELTRLRAELEGTKRANALLQSSEQQYADDVARLRAERDEAVAQCAVMIDGLATVLDLLNPLHGTLDKQTYDERLKANFDAPADAEYAVSITAQHERDLTQAVCILENRVQSPRGSAIEEAVAREAVMIGILRLCDEALQLDESDCAFAPAASEALDRIAAALATPSPRAERLMAVGEAALKADHVTDVGSADERHTALVELWATVRALRTLDSDSPGRE